MILKTGGNDGQMHSLLAVLQSCKVILWPFTGENEVLDLEMEWGGHFEKIPMEFRHGRHGRDNQAVGGAKAANWWLHL